MAWSFLKRVKIIPGIHLNFSKSGISTSIGFKDANVTIGKPGSYRNTSILELGLSKRQRISEGSIQPQLGLNNEYSIRNYEFSEAFGNAFSDFQSFIKHIRAL